MDIICYKLNIYIYIYIEQIKPLTAVYIMIFWAIQIHNLLEFHWLNKSSKLIALPQVLTYVGDSCCSKCK